MHSNIYHLPARANNSGITWFAIVLGILLVLLTSFIATEYLACCFKYSEELPGNYTMIGNIKLYQPFAWVIWNWHYKNYIGAIEEYFTVAHFIIAIGSIISLLVTLFILYQKSKKSHITFDFHGSARWATKEEIIKTGLLTKSDH